MKCQCLFASILKLFLIFTDFPPSCLTFIFGMLELSSYNFILTILKYLLSLSLFIFIFIKIIPRVYKITESVNSTDKNISLNAKILSSESNEPILNVTGFVGLYAKILNFLLNHPSKVIISAIIILIAVNYTYTKVGEGVEFFPDVEPDLAKIVVYARGNLSVEEKKD